MENLYSNVNNDAIMYISKILDVSKKSDLSLDPELNNWTLSSVKNQYQKTAL